MAASVKEAVQVIHEHISLDVFSLAKLCLSSVGLHNRLIAVVSEPKALAGLLKQALGNSLPATDHQVRQQERKRLHQKRAAALSWLRKQLDESTAAAALEELTTATLVNIPNVPLAITTVLVRDWGVRPSCVQLVQAARDAVPGVEAWVKAVLVAQPHNGFLSSFPTWMQALSQVRAIPEFL